MLAFGVIGIYACFSYMGVLIADMNDYTAPNGEKLEREWFVQTVEAGTNVLVGALAIIAVQGGPSRAIPWGSFVLTGTTQVLAKAMTQKAMNLGIPFFVATLCKNAKMVPVMLGAIILSGESYSMRKYFQVFLIIAGVVVVSTSKPKKGSEGGSDLIAYLCLILALTCDGLTGGQQTAMKKTYQAKHKAPLLSFDMMFFTNFVMMCIAFGASVALGQLEEGYAYVMLYPEIRYKLGKYALCSALGQSFIFFTISNFGPLTTTTVTTTRKIFSVLLDIYLKARNLNLMGWSGVALASLGVLGELQEKFGKKHSPKKKP